MSASLKWKLIAGFVVVFFAGLAAGAFLGAVQSRHHRMNFNRIHPLAERVRNRMQQRLELTPEQIKQTAPIFDKTARELEAIRAETGRRVHETLAASDRELAPVLTPAQRAKLAAMQARRDADRDKPEGEVAPGGHP
jgi:Spy/CpxP family protein refolding chaperone